MAIIFGSTCEYDCAQHECIWCGNRRSHETAIADGPCTCTESTLRRVYARYEADGDPDDFQTVAYFVDAGL